MLKMIEPEQALDLVLLNATRRPSSLVPLSRAVGLVLDQTVRADRDYPPFHRAMMDGYAVRLGDAGRTVTLAGEVAAGAAPEVAVEPGACVAVMTGAACPEGAEAVVMVEQTEREGDRVRLPAEIRAGQHIAGRGSECPAGDVVARAGDLITPLLAAVLASVGRRQVQGVDRPRAAVITTGSELCPPDQRPGPQQIRDSNGPMLAAQLQLCGLDDPLVLHAEDTEGSLATALSRADEADLVLLSGGVSMGRYDLVPGALEAHGATAVFHKVRQKPGKPLLFATREEQLIFGLPGNPLSSHFCFHRYVAPAARAMAGRAEEQPWLPGTLVEPLAVTVKRHLFVPAHAGLAPDGLGVRPLLGKGSADIWSVPTADAYIWLQPGEHDLAAGAAVKVQWMGEPRWAR